MRKKLNLKEADNTLLIFYCDHQDEDLQQYIREKTRFETELLGASSLANVTQGRIIQINRKGFFICDQAFDAAFGRPLVLFSIPDGHKTTQGAAATTVVNPAAVCHQWV